MAVVEVFGIPGWPPLHELSARTLAAVLARSSGGPIVDMSITKALSAEDALASIPEGTDLPRVADWVMVLQSAGERGMWMTTKGLSRFGLPELEVEDLPPQAVEAWTSILTGIALGLVRRFSQAIRPDGASPTTVAFVELDRLHEVRLADLAAAYAADPPEEDAQAWVQLEPRPQSDPDADSFLAVSPPDAFSRSRAEFFIDVAADLLGHDAAEVRYVAPTDEMDAAMATAISCLDVARARFLAGEFQARTLLMVKWQLDHADGTEYPWAFVTDWSDVGVLQANSASDADHDPSVRVGRPLRLRREAVVDWGVWVDGEGLIEGGWTNALLEGQPPPPVPPMPKPRRRFGRR